MKQLSKLQSIMFLVGGLMMVVGAGCFVFFWHQKTVCWIFAVGALMFAMVQAMQLYEGRNFTIKRLKKIQCVADIFFVLSAILMVDSAYGFLLPLFQNVSGSGYLNYIQYVYNKWVLLLLIAAILELYSTHRIASELKKEDSAPIDGVAK
jgi:hypothetical protein